jgi:phospholipid/cholesterol/gamma-HCH transport system ATP-binding protein
MMTAAPQEWLLKIEGLHKCFGEQVVLAGASLAVPRGSLVAILGRSGAGKSVFLKCLANVIEPDAGEIWFDGQPLGKGDSAARQHFRGRCSFLFQSNALFDSLTALENVALPLEQTMDLPTSEVKERSLEALKQLELEAFSDRYPGQMSGGMQKRLALARAIVTRPELVLFDEPTAGLDPVRRNAVFTMIGKYQRQFGFTHDVPEALVAADLVALLDTGKIVFQGSPGEFIASDNAIVRQFRDSEKELANTLESIRRGEIIQSEDT